jgi:hypothetical protein
MPRRMRVTSTSARNASSSSASSAPSTSKFRTSWASRTIRRKSGLAGVQQNLSWLLAVQGEVWAEDQLRFRVSALGKVASGTIDVNDDHVRLDVMLPWMAALLAAKIQPAIRALEKKGPNALAPARVHE